MASPATPCPPSRGTVGSPTAPGQPLQDNVGGPAGPSTASQGAAAPLATPTAAATAPPPPPPQDIIARPPDLSSPSQATVRPRKPSAWKKNVALKRRNEGQEYVSAKTGKLVSARQVSPPCKCIKKCYEKIGEENIRDLFTHYWNVGNWNVQTAYLQKQVTINDIKSKHTGSPSKQRTCSRTYHVTVLERPIQV